MGSYGIGVGRVMAAIVEQNNDEHGIIFPLSVAPYKVAVLPLTKKQSEKAEEVYATLAKHFSVEFDVAGQIGKRYRRQDAIGTPYCVTVDFDTMEDNAVTVRDRDTMEQVRLPIDQLVGYIQDKITF